MHFKWPGSWVWRSLWAQKVLAFDSGDSSGLLCEDPSPGTEVGPGECPVASLSLALPIGKVASPQAPHSFGGVVK